tara:strand:+ start:1401 stop:1565 length:165 start_codon:yes stop_codon:yes gene_type:complete
MMVAQVLPITLLSDQVVVEVVLVLLVQTHLVLEVAQARQVMAAQAQLIQLQVVL